MAETNDTKIAVLSTKFDTMESELKEIKTDVKSSNESLINLTNKLDSLVLSVNDMKARQEESIGAFLNKNSKIILGIIILSIGGLSGNNAIQFIMKLFS